MPVVFGTTITGVSYASLTLTCDGYAFGVNEYAGTSDIQISPSGAGTWTSVDSISSWSDSQVVGTFLADPAAGLVYDVKVISSDGEEATYTAGFSMPGGNMFMDYIESLTTHYGIY